MGDSHGFPMDFPASRSDEILEAALSKLGAASDGHSSYLLLGCSDVSPLERKPPTNITLLCI